jgi:hypothetical protein
VGFDVTDQVLDQIFSIHQKGGKYCKYEFGVCMK